RHGGTNIGAANEINGLTMGAVGRGTTIEFIEVYNNADDGYEWFGGTVNTRYLVSAFNDDDGFDYDEGWRGKNQFWFLIQDPLQAGSGGEHDGGTTPEDGQPFAIPIIYNATYIGSGAASGNARNDFGLNIRDNAGGKYYNSIFTDFFGRAVQIEDLASGEDSRARLEAGDLVLQNNIFFGFGAGPTPNEYIAQDFTRTYVTNPANNNRFDNPQLRGISRTTDGGLDPRPAAGSPALTGAATPPNDGFFVSANYLGAFGPNLNWAADWTLLSALGILTSEGGGQPTKVEERQTSAERPTDFTLSQNYPNPFNPSTSIDYAVAKTGFVRLAVYNVLGQRVATLVEGLRTAGTYTVTWDATGLTTGMYFYRLEARGVVQTRKMLLTR
ncbi:T9SS type A sorting domain-containing protein, partial [candidate division KSB1 bacterium]|nr:T9SS type A sorting domain-containing protein [candidate division KSB1 bacterium]